MPSQLDLTPFMVIEKEVPHAMVMVMSVPHAMVLSSIDKTAAWAR